jgi:DNA-binding transcriptional regulator LsrR (DeoR family)
VLKEKGAQGHLLARMFDADGKEIPIPGKNAVSPPLDTLKKIRWTIGIAVSARKALAVKAAVRAGYINSLVIDSGLADALLKNN